MKNIFFPIGRYEYFSFKILPKNCSLEGIGLLALHKKWVEAAWAVGPKALVIYDLSQVIAIRPVSNGKNFLLEDKGDTTEQLAYIPYWCSKGIFPWVPGEELYRQGQVRFYSPKWAVVSPRGIFGYRREHLGEEFLQAAEGSLVFMYNAGATSVEVAAKVRANAETESGVRVFCLTVDASGKKGVHELPLK